MCCNHKSVDLSLLNDVLEHYADVKGSLITILQKTQDIYGYVPIDAVYHIAERTGLTPAKIMGVATFYSQFRFTAVGKYLIMVCKGTACYVNGAERIIDAISEELGIPAVKTLEKFRDNQANSGLTDLAERRANVLGVYRPVQQETFRGRRVLLLDDIVTTGATASECARVLLTAGAGEILFGAVAAGGTTSSKKVQ